MTSTQEQTAARLIVLAQNGDAHAYADLLTLLAGIARQFARNRLGDVPWLDDVAQETLLTIHKARHTYDAQRPFAPWFYAILANRMVDVLRRERRVGAREIGTDVLPDRVEPVGESEIDIGRLTKAVSALPRRQREIVIGLKFRDESVKTLSARTGMSESAVKVTAHRAYRSLRRLLGGPGED
jgi:RNA polymerase sigma-70 factor (ECF subfamily)